MFGGLAPLVMEKFEDAGNRIVVRARMPLVTVAWAGYGLWLLTSTTDEATRAYEQFRISGPGLSR
jgi:hypothetical protein